MECKKINTLLIDFADKKLDATKTELVQAHLQNCKNCRQEVEELAIVMNKINIVQEQQPSNNVRANFLGMLEEEKQKRTAIEAKPIEAKTTSIHAGMRFINPMYQIAAGFAILISGVLLGLLINKNSGMNNSELLALQTEVSNMKQVVMLSKLNQSSPSSRIQAVNYVDELSSPEPKVLKALISTMNEDENSNVRLAATTALARFTDNETVRDALINALAIQDDPMVQITLINIMIGLHETKANSYIQRIANNENTNKSVKTIAQKGLKILI